MALLSKLAAVAASLLSIYGTRGLTVSGDELAAAPVPDRLRSVVRDRTDLPICQRSYGPEPGALCCAM